MINRKLFLSVKLFKTKRQQLGDIKDINTQDYSEETIITYMILMF